MIHAHPGRAAIRSLEQFDCLGSGCSPVYCQSLAAAPILELDESPSERYRVGAPTETAVRCPVKRARKEIRRGHQRPHGLRIQHGQNSRGAHSSNPRRIGVQPGAATIHRPYDTAACVGGNPPAVIVILEDNAHQLRLCERRQRGREPRRAGRRNWGSGRGWLKGCRAGEGQRRRRYAGCRCYGIAGLEYTGQ